jgi:hypothetical protein
MPPGLPPLLAPDTGDFLALLANKKSNAIAGDVTRLASSCIPEVPVIALQI